VNRLRLSRLTYSKMSLWREMMGALSREWRRKAARLSNSHSLVSLRTSPAYVAVAPSG